MRLEIPVTPDADTAREWARDELAKPEYQQQGENWLERFVRWLQDLIAGLGDGIGGAAGGWGLLATIVIVAGVIGLIVWLIMGPLRRSRAAMRDEDALVDPGVSADEYDAQASAALANGDLHGAVIAAFRALVRALDEREVIALRPGMTAHEATADAADALPDAAEHLTRAADVFDGVRYGHLAATRGHVDQLRAARTTADRARRVAVS